MAETKKSTTKKSPVKATKAKTAKAASQAKNQSAASDLIADNRTFTLTIPAADIAQARQHALEHARQRLKKDGFRQGHAPDALVEKSVGSQYILQHTLETAVPPAYEKLLQEKKLLPLTEPDLKPLSLAEGEDWTFEVAIAERPEIDVSKYESIVQDTKAKHPLWQAKTPAKKSQKADPEKDKEEKAPSEEERKQQRLQAILTALLEKITVRIPELLLRRETEYQLHELEHQLEHLQMSLADFLKNSGKTQEELQQDYATRAFGNLQVELLLGAIIEKANLKNTEAEISAVLQQRLANYPEGSKPQITTQDIQYVNGMLLKQKALDHLLNL